MKAIVKRPFKLHRINLKTLCLEYEWAKVGDEIDVWLVNDIYNLWGLFGNSYYAYKAPYHGDVSKRYIEIIGPSD